MRKWLKNKYYKEMADNINRVAQAREVEKEFTLAKKYTALKTGSKLMISNEKLKDHFENHFATRDLQIPPELTLYKLYAVPVRVCSTREDMHYP